jgi:hypothetical protein
MIPVADLKRGYHPLCAARTRVRIEPIEPIERRLAPGLLTMTNLLADARLRLPDADEIARGAELRQLLAGMDTPAGHESPEAPHNHEL